MRHIGRDRIGGLFQRGETVRIGGHEGPDLGGALGFEFGHNINQHQGARLKPGGQRIKRGEPAQRRPDEGGRPVECAGDSL